MVVPNLIGKRRLMSEKEKKDDTIKMKDWLAIPRRCREKGKYWIKGNFKKSIRLSQTWEDELPGESLGKRCL